MSRVEMILRALEDGPMTAPEVAGAVNSPEQATRCSLADLMNRILVRSSMSRPKVYSLTTLGHAEAQRMRLLAKGGIVASALSSKHPLTQRWNGASNA